MTGKMRSIPVAQPWIDDEEVKRVVDVVKSGWLSRGKEIELFEKEVAEYLGVKYGVSVSSGTAALEVTLRALDLQGREVITTVSSCVPTLNAILHAGCIPVFVDVEPTTYNIDAHQIKDHITDRTGAIVPVHLYGHSCGMTTIMELAEYYHLHVVEDCALSLGAKYKGKYTGTFGTAGCFSFYANKLITTGEGGMIVTNDPEIVRKANIIKNHGQHPQKPFYHILYGYNFKMSNIHAAIGLGQMKKLDLIIARKRRNAAFLSRLLEDVDSIELPKEMEDAYHVYFSYPILLKREGIRDKICKFLSDSSIETRIMFGPMCKQPFFEDLFGKYPEEFPVAEKVGNNGFYVSCSPMLQKEDLDYMAGIIRKGVNKL